MDRSEELVSSWWVLQYIREDLKRVVDASGTDYRRNRVAVFMALLDINTAVKDIANVIYIPVDSPLYIHLRVVSKRMMEAYHLCFTEGFTEKVVDLLKGADYCAMRIQQEINKEINDVQETVL